MDTKIAIAIVSNRQIKPKTTLALMNMIARTSYEVFPIMETEGYTIAEGRSYCVIQAKKNNCSHILFVDDDMTFPGETLERLLAHRKEIVGVYSFSRALPLCPTVSFLNTNGEHLSHDQISKFIRPQELFEVFGVGMGVTLIDMAVFDVIEKPWFYFESHESGKILVGEDAWFCRQARNKGLKVWCDPTLDIGHIGDYNFSE